ncbi:MAG TPA: hypothetical protein PKE26_00600 [Kiritimatiellia bacterium]|nr:hypothetical protein [Kiritimatiellia bacterium]HMO97592.1 hypothetical protein [Kiritimatiellia bacterium]HMP96789.1 hypothetical protein [Kiritimatiellia bacterium]
MTAIATKVKTAHLFMAAIVCYRTREKPISKAFSGAPKNDLPIRGESTMNDGRKTLCKR